MEKVYEILNNTLPPTADHDIDQEDDHDDHDDDDGDDDDDDDDMRPGKGWCNLG